MTDTTFSSAIRKLEDSQLQAFDHDHIAGEKWGHISKWIEESFPDGRFSFLDVGGGNGSFADSILDRFPNSHGTVLDNGDVLLDRNKFHPNKILIRDSAGNIASTLADRRFDLISFNWILHHLVMEDYSSTRLLQQRVLSDCGRILTPRGRVFVMECIYEGALYPSLPGWMIYKITSSRALAPLTRVLGANTAGCGVCFLNQRQWETNFEKAGLEIVQTLRYAEWDMSLMRRIGLLIRSVYDRQFLLSPAKPVVLA
jgi:ubiquinone/menaquinone biosynthesis C-methylase UbiE